MTLHKTQAGCHRDPHRAAHRRGTEHSHRDADVKDVFRDELDATAHACALVATLDDINQALAGFNR